VSLNDVVPVCDLQRAATRMQFAWAMLSRFVRQHHSTRIRGGMQVVNRTEHCAKGVTHGKRPLWVAVDS